MHTLHFCAQIVPALLICLVQHIGFFILLFLPFFLPIPKVLPSLAHRLNEPLFFKPFLGELQPGRAIYYGL